MKYTDKPKERKSFRAALVFCKVLFLAVLIVVSSAAQDFEVKFEQDKSGKQIPIGFTPRSILADTLYPYHRWFDRRYARYSPDTTITEPLNEVLTEDIELLVFYGTWCSDTRRELPRLMKILDTVRFAEERVKLYAVNRAKQSGDDFAKQHDVKRVATVIIYKDGEELGRIIETPKELLESDMLHILRRQPVEAQ